MQTVRCWVLKIFLCAVYASLVACSDAKTQVDFLKSLSGDSYFSDIVVKINGTTSGAGNNPTPSVEVSSFFGAVKIEIFNSATCETSLKVGESSVATSETTVTLTSNALSSDGVYEFYAKATSSLGITSECSKNKAVYTFDATSPAAPTAVALSSGSASPSNNPTPSVDVSGLVVGDYIKLYSDSLCLAEVASGTSVSSTQTLTIMPALSASATYNIYAMAIDVYGNASACSSSFATYDLDITQPPAPTSVTVTSPANNPGNNSSPVITVSSVTVNDVVTLFSDAACSSSVTSVTATSTSTAIIVPTLSANTTYRYYAQVTDPVGNISSCSSVYATYTYDNISPTVTNVTSSNLDKKFGPGATINIQMTWSEAVNVTGAPTLKLNIISPTPRYATYASGSGTNTLTFTYTVAPGDSADDLNYYSASSLIFAGGASIRDLASNNALLLLPGISNSESLGGNKNITIMPNPPKISFGGNPTLRIKENDPPSSLQINLEYDAHYDITVHVANYSTALFGVDYWLPSASILVPAGSTTQPFTLSIANDAIDTGNRRIRLALDSINGDFPGLLDKISQKEIHIYDDDSANTAIPQSLSQGYGSNHSCVIKDNGGVYCWGANNSGQLGDGLTTTRFSPAPVSGLPSGYSQVSTGSDHTCALDSNGYLKCWGSNAFGQLGVSSPTVSYTPMSIDGTNTYSQISVGARYSCGIRSGGDLYCWGYNSDYQLGDGYNTPRTSPVRIDSLTSYMSISAGFANTCGVTSAGVLKCWGNGAISTSHTPAVIDSVVTYVKAAVGGDHACAITQDGALNCWGDNTYGQVGNNSNTDVFAPTEIIASNVTDVVLGSNHTCALLAGGELRCWGANSAGQVGDGTTEIRASPVSMSTGIAKIMAGANHTCSIASTSGETKCWGDNTNSSLGSNDAYLETPSLVESNFSSVAVGATHSCGLASGAVRCWGKNADGEVGDGTQLARTSPVQVIDSGAVQVAVGDSFSCAVLSSGKLQCWGSNAVGRLGDNNTSSRRLRPYDIIASGVLQVDLGASHGCARMDTGAVQCWGNNTSSGRVGNGSNIQQNSPVEVLDTSFGATDISVSATHACALNSSGGLYCWGDNSNGQFGTGTPTSSSIPFDTGLFFARISTGTNYSCGIEADKTLKCWGFNSSSQLGDGTTTTSNSPVIIDSGVGYTQVAASTYHTCGVTDGGSLKCWGISFNSQIGPSSSSTPLLISSGVTSVSTATFNTCFRLTNNNEVKCLGANANGVIGNGDLTLLRLPIHVFGL